jgi:predicted small secreted protein
MKKIYFVFAISSFLFLTSCYTTRTAGNSGKVPPGKAKKAAGSKSAKPFAPGQQKKN